MFVKLLTEAVGTFILVFTIGMTVLEPHSAGVLTPPAISFVLMALIYGGRRFSGAHYNPAVTISVFFRGACDRRLVLPYIATQALAACAASGAAVALKGDGAAAAMAFEPFRVIAAEFFFTFALCFVILLVATSKATAGNSYYGAAIALTVLAGIYAAGPISGGVMNPAVAIGFGIMGLADWADLWMHLLGEFAGALAAAGLFRTLIRDEKAA